MIITDYLINYCLVVFAMTIDNLFWMTYYNRDKDYFATDFYQISSKWLSKLSFFERWGGFNFAIPKTKRGWVYIWTSRISNVGQCWRDIIPALITAGIMTIIQGVLW